ncbi:restriction endonuclease subunit S [Paenibacillus sp. BJ-4]|uniref:restriction endonuclease subunit S n=1 Tax=Paenibacillus sp. BJ-4 TaxID=2878097 RepID=UPI001CF09ACD|nr:restriction endonuclease subunit S [Paenibacillus sp. BJ-4]
MKYVELKHLCSPKQWKTVSTSNLISSGYPVYGANGIIGYHSEYNHKFPTLLVTCRGATCGEVNICEPFSYVNGNAMALDDLDESKVNIKYLYYYLKYRGFKDIISGSAQPQIIRSAIEKIKIPLIELAVQVKIVETVDKIIGVILKRQSQITVLDELTQSLFLETFGDPIQNLKDFKKLSLNNVLSNIQTGWSPVASNEPAINNEQGVLKLSAVTGGRYNFKENKKLLDGTPFKTEYEVKTGDILLTRKNTKELVGACSYVFDTQSNLMFSDLIFRLNIKDESIIQPIYLWRLLNTNAMKKELSSLASGSSGSMPNISKKNLNELLIIIPPINLQEEFINKIISLEQLRRDLIESVYSYEKLYESILQKAFKSELFQEQ